MPRYFFDTYDGEHHLRDEDGSEFPDVLEARDEAIRILPRIARDVPPDGDQRDFAATVRDERGQLVFRATLSLRTEWLISDVINVAPRVAVPGR